jgi:hypothetical protein
MERFLLLLLMGLKCAVYLIFYVADLLVQYVYTLNIKLATNRSLVVAIPATHLQEESTVFTELPERIKGQLNSHSKLYSIFSYVSFTKII